MKQDFQSGAHNLYRCAQFIRLLGMATVVPGVAQAVESPWLGDMPSTHIPLEMRENAPSTIRARDYSELLVRAAADQYQEGASGRYGWKEPPASSADWRGINRDTWYFLGYQVAAVGIIYVVPEEISGWSPEQKDNYSIEKWKDNVSNPQWDDDRWWINYILHPYWGGTYYIRAQQRGLDRGQSFLYSTLLSTLFEYGVEALFEQPSYQDLILTPVVGSLVGEYLFTPLRRSIQAQPGELGWTSKTILILTDPLGVLNAEVDRMLGVQTDMKLQFRPLVSRQQRSVPESAHYRQLGDPVESGSIEGWELRLSMSW